jgi:bifunctional ADP-heptose synthase (sugar kinase/adenylyltransferase)
MDTRDKILDCESAAALAAQVRADGGALKVVTGYFDVLVAEHIRRLRQIAGKASKLFVVVLDPPAPVLAARARAEIAAALAMVDYVVPAGKQAPEVLLSRFADHEIVREESADLLRAERLSQHVQRRHQP